MIRLANPLWRRVIFLFTCAVFLAVCLVSGRAWFADSLENSSRQSDLLRAAQLEPGDGEYWYKLGFISRWDIESTDTDESIAYFRRAVSVDPRSATYWMDLGDTYDLASQSPAARQAYQMALNDYPDSAEVHWRYGSFLLRQGETQQAYAEIRPALTTDPRLIPLAITRVWKATQNTEELLKSVLPDTEDAEVQALNWFCSEGDADAAMTTWKHMIGEKRAIPIKMVFPLENVLLAAGRGDDARQEWREALAASGRSGEIQSGDPLVFNGGFEFDTVDGGLDWHFERVRGINYDYDTGGPHSGKRALRVTFDGSQNFAFQGVWEDIPVQPNTRYHFEGYLRTAGVTTDSGIHFLINSPGVQQPPVILDNFTGDHSWEAQHADIATAGDMHVLRVMLFRQQSQRFDNKLEGTAWVDDVSLVPAGPGNPNP